MANVLRKIVVGLLGVAALSLLSGCTDWKKQYDGLTVKHQNLLGRYELCMDSLDDTATEKVQLSQALILAQQELAELKRQMEGGMDRTGFEGFDPEIDLRRGTITVTLANTVLFEPGKAEIKKSVISELDQIASVLQDRYRDKDVSVVGHTDSDPIKVTKDVWKDNWHLSSGRALAVVRYLVKKGIRAKNLGGVAAGEFRPVA
ncbi:MAG: OmpA family protein, partial [Dehalococcoidales bacterium]